MGDAGASAQTGVQSLPCELVQYILVEFTDCEARIMAFMVCRQWRRQLWAGRRYHWRQANRARGRCHGKWVRSMACTAIVRGHPAVGLWLLANVAHEAPKDHFARRDLCPLKAAVYAGDAATRHTLRQSGWRWTTATAYTAATTGDADVIDEVVADCGLDEREFRLALAWNGDVDRMRCLVDHDIDVIGDGEIVDLALYRGHTDLVDWLLARGADPNRVSECTASGRWFGMTPLTGVEWAVTRKFIDLNGKTVGKFASRGRLDVVQWAHAQNGVVIDPVILRKAVRGGQAAVATWLLDQGVGADPQAGRQCCQWLIRGGCLDDATLKILLERLLDADVGGLCDRDFESAACCDRLVMLQWMLKRVWGSAGATSPACRSTLWLKCLAGASHRVGEWMLSVGWVPPTDAISKITRRPMIDLDHVQWIAQLADRGCAWTANDCMALARCGHGVMLRRAVVDYKAPWNPFDCLAQALAADSPQHRATVAWIAKHARINAAAFERDLVDGNAQAQTHT
ncbi:Ankyrin repeat domain containing protein [Pandoravirus salinus]|uniref:Ankyrin repeat domain containing protein n=1 Tax=Pandoravirus salinus TaxID=1349410 RepID=S4VWV3_9VIRU|nr:ankyrin repeat domain [Pandoravirus salinus]AGO85139.2 Ankyrin repeat domain containing protein [Pandoravirus salinus]